MTFYALVKPKTETIHAQARNRAEALSEFSRMLKVGLTDKPTGQMHAYVLDEWVESGAHVVNATIPIWRRE